MQSTLACSLSASSTKIASHRQCNDQSEMVGNEREKCKCRMSTLQALIKYEKQPRFCQEERCHCDSKRACQKGPIKTALHCRLCGSETSKAAADKMESFQNFLTINNGWMIGEKKNHWLKFCAHKNLFRFY